MGNMVRLKDCPIYAGGLDCNNDSDGKWSLYFEDEVLQVIKFLLIFINL